MKRHIQLYASLGATLLLFSCSSDSDGNGDGDGDGTITFGGDGDGDGDGTDSGGDGDGDGDGTSGDGDGDGDGNTCGEAQFIPEFSPPNLMLVLDKSGSMVANEWDHDQDPLTDPVTRWNSLYNVADSILADYDTTINFGMQLFPSEAACACYEAGSCAVAASPEVGIGIETGQAIMTALPPADADNSIIMGGTPATAGINSAVSHILSLDGPDLGPDDQRYIIFVTDGAANCSPSANQGDMVELLETYDDTLPVTVQAAFDDNNIVTYVVGIDIIDALVGDAIDGSPEANPYEKLNEVAVAGGAEQQEGPEKFYNVANEAELQAALTEIAGVVGDCKQTLDPPPSLAQLPYIKFTDENGEEIPLVEDCEAENGWVWITELEEIEFCGSYCADFKGGASFDGVFGCPPPG